MPASLAAALRDERALFVTLSDAQYADSFGGLFRDRRLVSFVPTLRQMLRPVADLATCSSEKGDTSTPWRRPGFPDGSVFGAITKTIAPASETFLVCDDLGDEWADFIGIDATSSRPCVSLYHAKPALETTPGASSLHDVVAPALKNTGRAAAVQAGDPVAKVASWKKPWKLGAAARTRVQRGGTAVDVARAYVEASNRPAFFPRLCLVVSHVSARGVEAIVNELHAHLSGAPAAPLEPHPVQLVHLLVTFAASAKESNADPVLHCAP